MVSTWLDKNISRTFVFFSYSYIFTIQHITPLYISVTKFYTSISPCSSRSWLFGSGPNSIVLYPTIANMIRSIYGIMRTCAHSVSISEFTRIAYASALLQRSPYIIIYKNRGSKRIPTAQSDQINNKTLTSPYPDPYWNHSIATGNPVRLTSSTMSSLSRGCKIYCMHTIQRADMTLIKSHIIQTIKYIHLNAKSNENLI